MKQIFTSPQEDGHGIGPRTEPLLSTLQEPTVMILFLEATGHELKPF